jgi:ParB family chromosome partitioning protein
MSLLATKKDRRSGKTCWRSKPVPDDGACRPSFASLSGIAREKSNTHWSPSFGDQTTDPTIGSRFTDDHARQERVFENLSYNRDPSIIRRDLTKMTVPATDRCAIFVGAQAYTEAGGNIIRDLFTEDRGGFFEDPALLDRLAIEKLEGIAAEVQQAEGWKWTAAYLDFPHAHGLRRAYPHPVELSEETAAAYDAAQDELERVTAEWEDADIDLPPEVDARLAELEAEIDRIDAKRHAYDPDDIARRRVLRRRP